MNTKKLIPLAAALLLAVAGASGATSRNTLHEPHHAGTLLPAQKGDMVPLTLRAVPTATGVPAVPHADHAPAHVSWKLDASRPLQGAPRPFDRTSREYWQDASADELKRGLSLPTSTPGALIRLSPTGGRFGQIDPQKLEVIHNSKILRGPKALSHSANSTQLRGAGMMVADGSVVVKLRDDIGPGPVTLRASDARGRYVVHVYEPGSPLVLHARTNRDTIVSGQSVRLRVRLEDAGKNRAMAAVGGFLVAPDGHVRNLTYARDAGGSYHVDVTPDASHADRRGLWELHTFTSTTDGKGNTVLRDATSAFALSVTDARLDGRSQVRSSGSGRIDVRIGIRAAQASRYAVSGVLYGHAADGSMHPAAYAQSATWLSAGRGTIDLRFDAGAVPAALHAPFELRNLVLSDQAHMGILERRAVALRFTP